MLIFNPKRIFVRRGIEKTTAFLVKLGLSYSTASRFLESKSRFVKVGDIEKLCVALNCTPNDLFEWNGGAERVLPETHSLNALQKRESVLSMRQMLKDVPSDKLFLIEKLVEEIKANGEAANDER